jgi:hypothetical protein
MLTYTYISKGQIRPQTKENSDSLELAASTTPTNVNNCLHYNLVLFGAFV